MSQHISRPGAELQLPQERLLADALSSIANAIFITDRNGCIVWANQACCRLTGYALEELLGCTPSLLKSGMQSASFYAELWRTVLAGNVWRGILIDRRKDRTLYTVDETITPLMDEQGAITHFIAIQHDISVQKQEHARDHYLAYHDVLTGLPNRALFLDLLRQAISHAKRMDNALALLFLDLDNFKTVNDTFGHDLGDRLLLAVAERLSAAVRKSDTVARFGGDEFAILLPDLLASGVASTLAGKLTDTIARPFVIAVQKISIGISIGIAICPADGEEPDELMRKADQAMYLAKKRGGNNYQFTNGHVS
jgi:diguanylate cyclase (GGDEF)-like protein/PAS domain S-box-containing protein